MFFFGSLADATGRSAIEAVRRHRSIFEDERACRSVSEFDSRDKIQEETGPGIRNIWDFDGGRWPNTRSTPAWRSIGGKLSP